jgi:D-glycero-alpha-D-manno-heptose-7-phosphate kinase
VICVATPFRVSLFGGGTDYPEWFVENQGGAINASIQKYCFVTLRRASLFGRCKYRVLTQRLEETESFEQIHNPVVRAFLAQSPSLGAVEITYQSDMPARSGLGSSSAFVVALLAATYEFRGLPWTPYEVAAEAVSFEREVLGETVGVQDQYACSVGGFNYWTFKSNEIAHERVSIKPENCLELQDNLCLIFSGVTRRASDIAASYSHLLQGNWGLKRLTELTLDALQVLQAPNLDLSQVGYLLDESWAVKSSLAPSVSTRDIDKALRSAKRNGALGGKLLGAGRGGFFLFVAPPDAHDRIAAAINSDYKATPVRFDYKGVRTQHI